MNAPRVLVVPFEHLDPAVRLELADQLEGFTRFVVGELERTAPAGTLISVGQPFKHDHVQHTVFFNETTGKIWIRLVVFGEGAGYGWAPVLRAAP